MAINSSRKVIFKKSGIEIPPLAWKSPNLSSKNDGKLILASVNQANADTFDAELSTGAVHSQTDSADV